MADNAPGDTYPQPNVSEPISIPINVPILQQNPSTAAPTDEPIVEPETPIDIPTAAGMQSGSLCVSIPLVTGLACVAFLLQF